MAENMTALEFWQAFSGRVMDNGSADRKRLCEIWNESQDFTAYMSDMITDIIKSHYGEDKITVQPEYLRIDIPAWQRKNRTDCHFIEDIPSFQKYDWDMKVAVEHENDYRLWMDEVIKLAHINCPLRVVIGYVHVDKTPEETRKKQERMLCAVAPVLNGTDAWQTVIAAKAHCPELQNDFLIILGDGNVNEQSRCHYTPYIYNFKTGRFESIIL